MKELYELMKAKMSDREFTASDSDTCDSTKENSPKS